MTTNKERQLRFEWHEIAVLAGIGVAHVLIIGLLLNSLINSDVLPDVGRIASFEIGTVAEPLPEAPIAGLKSAIDAPSFDIADQAPAVLSRTAGIDPFAGATADLQVVRSSPDDQGDPAVSISTQAVANDDDTAWFSTIGQRFQDRRKVSGDALAPAMIDVLARPAGGFADIRLRASTGSPSVDQELLAAIMLRQSLVPPGMVATVRWLTLPEIAFGEV